MYCYFGCLELIYYERKEKIMNCIVMKRFLLLVAILSITSCTFLLGYIDAYSINSEKVIQELINSIDQKRWNCFTEL
ncbi:hypothetical protein SAMN04487772_11556 [[Clostridium] polysaccharolyticum]|uniref:Uncharacterized protein n=1 Tax=[Clostridium] polysaccharolyticum TaxID=29364 RepID=A0A1I0DM81_9FIRM|nr:hypothetical protein SAMN04487772_11556 [[Clostridium] polysaccharolyticum]